MCVLICEQENLKEERREFTSQWKILVEYEAEMFGLGGAIGAFLLAMKRENIFRRVGHEKISEEVGHVPV